MHILIIFNPTSGSAKRAVIDRIVQLLESAGATVELYLTQSAQDATHFLENYHGSVDIVAAAGGDGTINEVINGLKQRANDSWRLAIIPTGTTNVLAGELKLSAQPEKVVNAIMQGAEMPIYPGRINGQRFLLMTGVGYDAWVVDNVDLSIKKKFGKLAYVLSMLKQLPKFGKTTYQVTLDEQQVLSANSVIITNGRLYGGKFVLSRQAHLSSPTTQVIMLNGRSMWHLLFSLLALPLGLIEKMPGVTSLPARRVKVELANNSTTAKAETQQPEPVQADGDSLTHLPLHLEMEPTPLRVLVPR